MRVFSATVQGGAIVADDVDLDELPDGASVTIVVEETGEFELTAEEAAAVDAGVAAADRGDVVTLEALLAELRQS